LKMVREAIWEAYRKLKETVITGKGREKVEALYDQGFLIKKI